MQHSRSRDVNGESAASWNIQIQTKNLLYFDMIHNQKVRNKRNSERNKIPFPKGLILLFILIFGVEMEVFAFQDQSRVEASIKSASDPTGQQRLMTGTIYDRETGETLPAATVQIVGTYKGTVSNAEGRFELLVERLPAEILVRFLGYQSQTLQISDNVLQELEIYLEPSTLTLPELVITEEDPALSIMERVIARKQI